MSSGLMETDAGGENQQYEGNLGIADAQKKSSGQLGQSSDQSNTTTNPAQTAEGQAQAAERGEKTAENIRYGQTLSETGGMGGMTKGMDGSTEQGGYGKVDDVEEEGSSAKESRRQQGYGGKEDMDREIGA
ncbi:hypothetical protein LTR17_011864 [Elasticomyces elasticus]|nr:hypothetical protein LTR17_011864 [Elasticomyces elasticus]